MARGAGKQDESLDPTLQPKDVRTVGIVPAAGRGTRAQPLDCSKEVCAVWGRPLLAHLVERMREADVDEIRVVTRPDKDDVASCARALGAQVALGSPQSVGESIAAGSEGLAPGDVVLIGFPDTVWEAEAVFPSLLAKLGAADVCLALFRHADPAAADVVSLGRGGRVTGVEVKPERPDSDLIWGCAVVRASVLGTLDDEPGRTFDALARRGHVAAVRFAGAFADLGVRERLERALAGAPLDAVSAG